MKLHFLVRFTLCFLLLLTGFACCVSLTAAEAKAAFQSARPIWPEGREKEKNLTVAFRAVFTTRKTDQAILRLTGHALYRAFVNGEFVAHGPARAGQGFYRVDEWALARHLRIGANVVVIEVAGYNVNSYYLLDEPSFLQAEVVVNGKVVASTAGQGVPFEASIVKERVQKVQRYSFQRPFIEVWRLTSGWDSWCRDPGTKFEQTRCAVVVDKALLPRRVPYPAFAVSRPVAHLSRGQVQKGELPRKLWKDRSLTEVGPLLGGFPEAELATVPSTELQSVQNASSTAVNQPWSAKSRLDFAANSFHTLDFGTNLTGFIGARIVARQPTRLYFTFDEILSGDDVNSRRLGCVNAVLYELQPGTYEVESFEPYTLRYLKLIALDGDCEVADVHLREYVNPEAGRARFATSDDRFNRIFVAARQTFQQNAVDIFMDCPSRERAGWLCDSYFTARVALDLCGNTTVEKNFLENFLVPAQFEHLPDGMLPMCYPADHYNGMFIPNWALWFVVELEEYVDRSGDRDLVEALRPRVLKLFEYFKPFENEDGLLEKLQSWVFVEWSKANSFVQDVNYPSNMLYAKALSAAARLYGRPDLARKADQIQDVIRKQSFDGEFFVDNAVRKDGKLQVTRNRSEVCQYFAFFFEVATPETHAKLWQTLVSDFGPQRKESKKWSEVHPANAFIGNQLRFELLSRHGRGQQILDEALGYWLYMADRTGTLWENDGAYASCNHGFASHAAHVFYRDVLGLYQIDALNKRLQVRLSDLNLEWCEGTIPVAGGQIQMRWSKDGDKLAYRLKTPPGWKVEVKNFSGRKLVKQ